MNPLSKHTSCPSWREQCYTIIFESDTQGGKLFDLILILSILVSVGLVMMDSVTFLHEGYTTWLWIGEWLFTLLFSLEYALRLCCVSNPIRYALSMLGIIDLLAILPSYLSLLLPGTQYLMVIRVLRVLRIFRVLKLVHYVGEIRALHQALAASRRKITVFLFSVLTLMVIFGSLMYLVEGPANGFTSIPRGIYWAIVTMTTVGYGDISPQTSLGQTVASLIMILGYGILAVPTGIVTTEMARTPAKRDICNRVCPACLKEGHDSDALYCKYCAAAMSHTTIPQQDRS
ncbi:MAG: ion transporter [Deltaproteobacteria bacterium]|nr:MAG: ion transporter [Deltaproteobacteria bacterium]